MTKDEVIMAQQHVSVKTALKRISFASSPTVGPRKVITVINNNI